jgi:cell division septation protein DedD
VTARFDPRMHAFEEQTRFSGMIYVLMLVVALAFGGFVWQLYSAPDIPRIEPEPGPYKTAPTTEAPTEAALDLETTPLDSSPPVEAAAADNAAANGPFVAQLAALRSEAGVEPAWERFAARAPDLFASAQLDVERADLGARGVYFRLRAGYFPDRAAAARFCERIREMGQDCIPAAR